MKENICAPSHVEVWINFCKRKNGKQIESNTQDIILIDLFSVYVIEVHERICTTGWMPIYALKRLVHVWEDSCSFVHQI